MTAQQLKQRKRAYATWIVKRVDAPANTRTYTRSPT
jgi:hypothetical protein